MRARTLALLLAVSVALNLFFLGVVAARAWQRYEWQKAREAHGPVRRVRRESRQPESMRWLTDAERDELRPRRKALRGLREEASQLLRAERFDSGKLRETLDALRGETDAIQAAVHELLIRRAETLSVEQRRGLADAWSAQGGRARGKGRGRRGGNAHGDVRHEKARGAEK